MIVEDRSVILTTTNKCNLNCVYCYESRKNESRMSFEMAQKIISTTLSEGLNSMHIGFHGGEPFLYFDLIIQVCEWTWANYPDHKIDFFTTTNGTILTHRIKEWLSAHNKQICVTVSLDGTPQMNKQNRGAAIPKDHLHFFQSNWSHQAVKMTISTDTIADLADGIIYAHSFGFEVNANLALGLEWNDSYSDMYRRELKKLLVYYLENKRIKPCSIFSASVAKVLNEKEALRHCGAGSKTKSYDTAGNCYPCHLFDPNTLETDNWSKISDLDFKNNNALYQDSSCSNCLIYNVCSTCYGYNYLERGDIGKRDKRLCSLLILEKIAISEYLIATVTQKNFEDITEKDFLELSAAKLIIETYGKL